MKVTKDVSQATVSIHPVNEKMMLNGANSDMKRTVTRFKCNYESTNITKDKNDWAEQATVTYCDPGLVQIVDLGKSEQKTEDDLQSLEKYDVMCNKKHIVKSIKY